MGLKDTVPEDVDVDTSGGGGQKGQSEDREVIGSPPNQKVFSEEKFERVKDILRNEMGYMPNKVLNNFSAEKRHEVLHEAALLDERKLYEEEMEHRSKQRCVVCGQACDQANVEIEGELVCPNHPAVKVRKSLDEKQNSESAETVEEK